MNSAAEAKFFNEIEAREARQRDELVAESELREQIVEDAAEERLERAATAK